MIGGSIWFIRVNSQGERVWFDGKMNDQGELIANWFHQRTRQPSKYTIRASISLGERENYRMELRWGGEGSHRGYPEDRRMGLQMLVSPVSTDLSQKTCSYRVKVDKKRKEFQIRSNWEKWWWERKRKSRLLAPTKEAIKLEEFSRMEESVLPLLSIGACVWIAFSIQHIASSAISVSMIM